MADVLVPVGRHFLTPAYIDRLASEITPEDIGEHGIAVKFGVDTDGVKIAAVFTPKGDHFAIRTAFEYTKDQGARVGVGGNVKF